MKGFGVKARFILDCRFRPVRIWHLLNLLMLRTCTISHAGFILEELLLRRVKRSREVTLRLFEEVPIWLEEVGLLRNLREVSLLLKGDGSGG